MKVVKQNAVTLLLERINTLVEANQHSTWRCIYFNLSDSQSRHRQGMYRHFVVNAVSGLLEEEDGYIYICEDGDIFIMFKGALKPIVNRLGTHFAGIRPRNLGEQPEDARFTIFDLSKYWPVLFKLCGAKYLQTTTGNTLPAHLAQLASAGNKLESLAE